MLMEFLFNYLDKNDRTCVHCEARIAIVVVLDFVIPRLHGIWCWKHSIKHYLYEQNSKL